MEVVRADLGCLPEICGLYQELYAESAALQPESYRVAVCDEGFVKATIHSPVTEIFLAKEESQVVGFACVEEKKTPPFACIVPRRYAYLADLCVTKAHRSRGVGSRLLEACRQWGRERELSFLELNVLEENADARRLYQREGFAEASRILRYPL